MKILWGTPQWWICAHPIHQTQRTHHTRSDPKVHCGLWVIRMYQCRLPRGNYCQQRLILTMGGGGHGVHEKSQHLPVYFAMNLKLHQKTKSIQQF